MKDRISTDQLKQRINQRMRKLGDSGIFISGSLVSTGRKCGSQYCHCATGGEKHPCCLLTSKVKGKAKAVYVPVDMQEEVAKWVKENKKIKQLLKKVDQLSEQLIRQHVDAKRSVSKNLERLNRLRHT